MEDSDSCSFNDRVRDLVVVEAMATETETVEVGVGGDVTIAAPQVRCQVSCIEVPGQW